jgi:hypothetical protein
MYYVDPNYAKGAWHTVEGMLLMFGGLALLQLEMGLLNLVSDLLAPADQQQSAGFSNDKPSAAIVSGARA